jgi:hypothetical protein
MQSGRHRTVRPFARDVVACAAAVSAGAHAALVPEHLREARQLGIAFIVSAVLLLAAAGAATLTDSRRAVAATALLFAGLVAAYVISRTTGIPWLQPEAESADAVGLATKVVEALGLFFALKLIQPVGDERSFTSQEVMP